MQKQPIDDLPIFLPKPTVEIEKIFAQLKLFSKQRLDTNDQNTQNNQNQAEIKGLKFISTKLAKLFFKNRKLSYNQISKILIDNFASQKKDQRNIKRRVYDAINVLVAAGILIKKNNEVQMIKNKIKPKLQVDKRDKLQESIKQKQALINKKKKNYELLLQKQKLIKKMFNRNRIFKQHIRMQEEIQQRGLMNRRLSKKRSRNVIQAKNEDKSCSKLFPNTNSEIIEEPHIFIVIETDGIMGNNNFISKHFESHDKIELTIPSRSQLIEENNKNLEMSFMNSFLCKKQNQEQFASYMEDEKSQMANIEFGNQGKQQNFTKPTNIYSLVDVLQHFLGDGK